MTTELAPYLSFTPEGLLGVFVAMIMLGYLVPLRIVRGRLSDKQAIIDAQTRTIEILQRNNRQLLKGNTATVQVMEALPDALPDPVGSTPDDDVV